MQSLGAAVEIGPDDLPKGKARELRAEVRGEHGQQVVTVAVAMTVHHMNPSHAQGGAISHNAQYGVPLLKLEKLG
jgi:hypothetical protein